MSSSFKHPQRFIISRMKFVGSSVFPFLFALHFSFLWATSAHPHQCFLHCLTLRSENSTSISKLIYTPANSSYSSVLQFSLQNPRFSTPATPKPLVILTPLHVSHIQAAINCSLKHGMQIRVRSGGHDYEGLSYVSDVPFVIIDLINLRSVFMQRIERHGFKLVQLSGKFIIGLPRKVELLAFRRDFARLWALVDTSAGEGTAHCCANMALLLIILSTHN